MQCFFCLFGPLGAFALGRYAAGCKRARFAGGAGKKADHLAIEFIEVVGPAARDEVAVDDDFWVGHRANILWFFRQPGTQVWWPNRRASFSRRFQEFLDTSTHIEIDYPAARRY